MAGWSTGRPTGGTIDLDRPLPKYLAQVADYTGMLRAMGQPMQDGSVQRLREP